MRPTLLNYDHWIFDARNESLKRSNRLNDCDVIFSIGQFLEWLRPQPGELQNYFLFGPFFAESSSKYLHFRTIVGKSKEVAVAKITIHRSIFYICYKCRCQVYG